MIFSTCHKCSSTGSTLGLGVVLFQDDPVLYEVTDVWSLIYIVNYIDYVSRVNHTNYPFPYLHGWVVPGYIVEAEIISEYEKDVRLSVELGSSLLLL